jgi:hypothetical protein
MRLFLGVVLIVSVTSLVFASRASRSVQAVGKPLVANPALPDPCGVPQGARVLLGIAGQVGGVEYLPSALLCKDSAHKAIQSISLNGHRVADTLDRLVAFDPRYRWAAQDGVVVMRPVEAWDASDHFFNKRVPMFSLNDMTLLGATHAFATILAGFPITGDLTSEEHRTNQGLRRFSLSLTDTTPLTALNAIARQHGAAVWEVTYCKPEARYKFATISFRTFDGDAIGAHTATLDANGKMQEDCFRE